ncbi:hypothetical protein MLD38_023240 [Melastoma candidum]|uniref:Uncharacterized protein n=1 Tax=Melastoma candidum TaxID=119954 RepID=A0ACB9QN28_9MYRT|nr:hypothetical protein MLD38_023240 [Melastoma candidum]
MKLMVASFGGGREAPVSNVTGKQIQLDSDYLETFSRDVKFEFNGILHYVCASIWELTGCDPQPVFSGIADYVRLKRGGREQHGRRGGQAREQLTDTRSLQTSSSTAALPGVDSWPS